MSLEIFNGFISMDFMQADTFMQWHWAQSWIADEETNLT